MVHYANNDSEAQPLAPAPAPAEEDDDIPLLPMRCGTQEVYFWLVPIPNMSTASGSKGCKYPVKKHIVTKSSLV